jgi:hypothetical protein
MLSCGLTMAEVTVIPKRIGGSVAVFLPAEVVRREGIREGVPVRLTVGRPGKPRVLGLLKGKLPYEPFDRHKEGFWPAD